jgi:hypothetical protein
MMKRRDESKTVVDSDSAGRDPIAAYSHALPAEFRAICDLLREMISRALPDATSKVWHGSPVWFDDPNPIVGYSATAKAVNLLFWNGQAFEDPTLTPVGKFRAAQASFKTAAEIDRNVLQGWLKKARADVFDSHGYFKQLRESKKENR